MRKPSVNVQAAFSISIAIRPAFFGSSIARDSLPGRAPGSLRYDYLAQLLIIPLQGPFAAIQVRPGSLQCPVSVSTQRNPAQLRCMRITCSGKAFSQPAMS